VKPEDFVVGGVYFYGVNEYVYTCTEVGALHIKFRSNVYYINNPSHRELLAKYIPVSSLLKELF
jgi:hypothetical protein